MKRSGGLTGKTMSAQFNFELTKEEWDELVAAIKNENILKAAKMKDSFNYTIEANDDVKTRVAINPALVPEKFYAIFQTLFDRIKVQGK